MFKPGFACLLCRFYLLTKLLCHAGGICGIMLVWLDQYDFEACLSSWKVLSIVCIYTNDQPAIVEATKWEMHKSIEAMA